MWTYEQTTGNMISPSGELVSTGYSGSPEGRNNSLMQAVAFIGPCPIGNYTMLAPVNSHVHGPYAIPLAPDSMNEMFGRDHILVHGDSLIYPGTASEGCIIQPHETRVKMWESNDHKLQVVEKV